MTFKKIWLCIIAVAASGSLAAQTPNFDRLKAKFDSGQVFQSDFNHQFTDSYTGEVLTSSGVIWIGQNGYKLESDDQILVVDGQTSQVYDRSRNRVIIDEYFPEDDDFAPSRLLSGLDTTYAVTEKSSDRGSLITLQTDDDFAVFSLVEISLNQKQNPETITAWDISDNESVTEFTNGSFTNPAAEIFTLKYPDDAEIVDMRN